MADLSQPQKRPASKDRRTHSAKARLTPPLPQTFAKEDVVKQAKERARSAKLIRSKHNASTKLFPRASGAPARFSSMYAQDFEGAYAPPADIRPTSPTRRNNPHPGKQFMVWRVPTREIGGIPYDEGLELPPEYLARNPDFDALDELGTSFDNLKLPPARPTNTDYGAYLKKQKAAYGGRLAKPKIKPVSEDILRRTIRGENTDNLDEWLQNASPEEQHMVLKMLKSAEENQVKETIHDVMQPGAARAVDSWLKTADDKEREVAVRLFSSLGSRQGKRMERSLSESSIQFRPASKNAGPRFERPSSRQPLPPPLDERKRIGFENPEGSKMRSRRLSAPPGAKPRPWPAGVWHHQPIRDPPPQVYHRSSVFGAVRGGASHYTVHPEWPDYYTDTVH